VHTLRLDRRGLFQAGAAGAAAVTVASGWQLLEGEAAAAPLPGFLRRSTWTELSDGALELLAGDRALPLRLTAVSDLPVAASIPALRGHDGAFVLRFEGPSGIAQGGHRLRNAQLGELELFLAPVEADGATRAYEAVVDRTIRIAGVNEEPAVVDPGARGAAPGTAAGTPGGTPAPATKPAAGRPAARPRLHRAVLRRGPARRVVVADLTLTGAGRYTTVRATLRHDGRAVARASARLLGSRRARLRFPAAGRRGHGFARGRHELVVTLVARDGTHVTLRRAVRVA